MKTDWRKEKEEAKEIIINLLAHSKHAQTTYEAEDLFDEVYSVVHDVIRGDNLDYNDPADVIYDYLDLGASYLWIFL